jgi:hypothetical protein
MLANVIRVTRVPMVELHKRIAKSITLNEELASCLWKVWMITLVFQVWCLKEMIRS